MELLSFKNKGPRFGLFNGLTGNEKSLKEIIDNITATDNVVEDKSMKRQTVNLPIVVPVGKYCWEYNVPGTCDFFNNEGGTPSCDLKFDQKDSKHGVLKDPICKNLQVVTKK